MQNYISINGQKIGLTDEQVEHCGNSVPPAFATALVRANWPEACGKQLNTMAQFHDAVAV